MSLPHLFSQVFALLFVSKITTELFLGLRNRRFFRKNYTAVPRELQEDLPLTEHQKALQYALSKSHFNKKRILFHAALLIFWLPLGGLELLDQFFYQLNLNNDVIRGSALILSFSIISSLLDLPWSYYYQFIIEEKFGFNKMNPSLFILDTVKQLLMSLVLGLPLMLLVLWLMGNFKESWWIMAWVVFISFQLLLTWIYPRFLAPIFNKFSPLEEGELKEAIQKLLVKNNFASQGVYVMDASKRSSHSNAYFTGFGKSKRIVLYDTLIANFEQNEILAVLAHELGHFKFKHIIKFLIMTVILSFLGFALLGQLSVSMDFFHAHWIQNSSNSVALLLFSLILPIYTFWLSPIFSSLSRKHEYQADLFAAHQGFREELKSALIKMSKDNLSPATADRLFIQFYYSHPPLLERLRALNK